MKIKVNEAPLPIKPPMTLSKLKESYDPDADIIIYNGFPANDLNLELKNLDEVYFIKRGRKLSQEELEHVINSRHTPKIAEKLKKSTIAVAGLGGLGSNIAVALSRIGIGHLILADFDIVEPSNLNRQQYFIDQLGMPKTKALEETLLRINPYNKITTHTVKIDPDNIVTLFDKADIVIEAFDKAEAKAMIIRECAKIGKTVIAASGMAGFGSNDSIVTKKINDQFYLVGDFENEARPGNGLMAPRVMIAAAKEANLAVELLLNPLD